MGLWDDRTVGLLAESRTIRRDHGRWTMDLEKSSRHQTSDFRQSRALVLGPWDCRTIGPSDRCVRALVGGCGTSGRAAHGVSGRSAIDRRLSQSPPIVEPIDLRLPPSASPLWSVGGLTPLSGRCLDTAPQSIQLPNHWSPGISGARIPDRVVKPTRRKAVSADRRETACRQRQERSGNPATLQKC